MSVVLNESNIPMLISLDIFSKEEPGGEFVDGEE